MITKQNTLAHDANPMRGSEREALSSKLSKGDWSSAGYLFTSELLFQPVAVAKQFHDLHLSNYGSLRGILRPNT